MANSVHLLAPAFAILCQSCLGKWHISQSNSCNLAAELQSFPVSCSQSLIERLVRVVVIKTYSKRSYLRKPSCLNIYFTFVHEGISIAYVKEGLGNFY